MKHEYIDIDQEIDADGMTLFIFRNYVNNATPQDIVELCKRRPLRFEFETSRLVLYYLANIFVLDGDTFTVRDEQFIETFARLALANEDTWDLPFMIMAHAPAVPNWSGDMLDWLETQELEIIEFILSTALAPEPRCCAGVGPGINRLLERYADYEAMQRIANRFFEEATLPMIKSLMSLSDDEVREHLVDRSLIAVIKGETPSDWLMRLKTDLAP